MKKVLTLILVALIVSGTVFASGSKDTATQDLTDVDYSKWPEKDITLVTNGRAGSSNDMLTRALAQVLNGINGHKVIVENIIDPTGYAAWKTVQNATPDGYRLTILSATAITAYLTGGSPLNFEDFTYLTGFYMDPTVIYCRSEEPYDTFAEMLEYAAANPGAVFAGTSAATNGDNILVQKFRMEMGYDLGCVTYSGGSEVTTAVLGGFVNFGIGDYLDIKTNVDVGDLKILGTFVGQRASLLPDVPTIKEQGIDIVVESTRGIAGPIGMAPELVNRINEVLREAYETEFFQDFIDSQSSERNYLVGEEYKQCYLDYADTFRPTLEVIMSQM